MKKFSSKDEGEGRGLGSSVSEEEMQQESATLR